MSKTIIIFTIITILYNINIIIRLSSSSSSSLLLLLSSLLIGPNVFYGCSQLSRLYVASSSASSHANFYSAISNSKLVNNIGASCISLTYTTPPTQYTNGTKTWSLCYEPGSPTPVPTALPTAAPTGNTVIIIITVIFITIITNTITITTSICMYIISW